METRHYPHNVTDEDLIGVPRILDKYIISEIYPKDLVFYKLDSKLKRCKQSIANVKRRISEGEEQLNKMIKTTRNRIDMCDNKINEIKRVLYT